MTRSGLFNSDMGPMWDPHVLPKNTHGTDMGYVWAMIAVVPIWDPHVRPDNTYGINTGSTRVGNYMGPIWDPLVGSISTYGINVGSIWANDDMGPIYDPYVMQHAKADFSRKLDKLISLLIHIVDIHSFKTIPH